MDSLKFNSWPSSKTKPFWLSIKATAWKIVEPWRSMEVMKRFAEGWLFLLIFDVILLPRPSPSIVMPFLGGTPRPFACFTSSWGNFNWIMERAYRIAFTSRARGQIVKCVRFWLTNTTQSIQVPFQIIFRRFRWCTRSVFSKILGEIS